MRPDRPSGPSRFPCPNCGRETRSRVLDSRTTRDSRRRRRECLECCQRFTTYEVVWEEQEQPPPLDLERAQVREAAGALYTALGHVRVGLDCVRSLMSEEVEVRE